MSSQHSITPDSQPIHSVEVPERHFQRIGEAGMKVLHGSERVAELKPMGQWDAAAFDRSFSTNVKGPYFLLQELLPVFANPASVVKTI